jgi:hypothetical protein
MDPGLRNSRTAGPTTPLSVAELGIRLRYRERATARWLGGLLLGILFVVIALAVGATGWLTLTVIGAYSLLCLVLAARSAVLLAQIRG